MHNLLALIILNLTYILCIIYLYLNKDPEIIVVIILFFIVILITSMSLLYVKNAQDFLTKDLLIIERGILRKKRIEIPLKYIDSLRIISTSASAVQGFVNAKNKLLAIKVNDSFFKTHKKPLSMEGYNYFIGNIHEYEMDNLIKKISELTGKKFEVESVEKNYS